MTTKELFFHSNRVVSALHYFTDKYLALTLFLFFKRLNYFLFHIEKTIEKYVENSKYIESNKFSQKISREKIVLLGMWMRDTQAITLKEICNELNVSMGYARQIKEIATNPWDHYYEYKRIMAKFETNTDKKDKRSEINPHFQD